MKPSAIALLSLIGSTQGKKLERALRDRSMPSENMPTYQWLEDLGGSMLQLSKQKQDWNHKWL